MSRKINVQKKVDEFKVYIKKNPRADFIYTEMREIGQYCGLDDKEKPLDLWRLVSTCLEYGFLKGMNHQKRQEARKQRLNREVLKRKKNEK